MSKCRLPYTIADGELVPAWLGDRDRPWLRDLLDEAASYVGQPLARLLSRWRHSDVDPRAGVRQAPAAHVLASWLRRSARGPARSAARRELFRRRALGADREQALQQLARRLGIAASELAGSLFADLPEHRLICWPQPAPDPTNLALATNTSMVRCLIGHAHRIELHLLGACRALLRTAWLQGANLQTVGHSDGSASSLWQRDTSPGNARAIASLLPLLPWCHRYRLTADCQIRADRGCLVLSTGDAILPGPEPKQYDSQLERNFARDFARARPDWLLLRESVPVTTAHGLAFPDFTLIPPAGQHTWLCEIAGLRDANALPAKLALLEHPRIVLCLPERALPTGHRRHGHIVPFRRRVPVERVLAIVDGGASRNSREERPRPRSSRHRDDR